MSSSSIKYRNSVIVGRTPIFVDFVRVLIYYLLKDNLEQKKGRIFNVVRLKEELERYENCPINMDLTPISENERFELINILESFKMFIDSKGDIFDLTFLKSHIEKGIIPSREDDTFDLDIPTNFYLDLVEQIIKLLTADGDIYDIDGKSHYPIRKWSLG